MILNIYVGVFVGTQTAVYSALYFCYDLLFLTDILFYTVSISLFLLVHLSKPGYLPTAKETTLEIEEQQSQNISSMKKNDIDQKERRCQICQIKQKMRSKHCKSCKKCIATFDHHCPWIDNCVGQKNKPLFLIFISFLAFQCLYTEIRLISTLYGNGDPRDSYGIFVASMLGICIMLFGTLMLFQVYSMLTNITTWEQLSWKKISYLKLLEKGKSPFNKGIIQNLKLYCGCLREELIEWQYYYVG